MRNKYVEMTLLEIYYEVRYDMEDYFKWADGTKEAYKTNFEKLGDYLKDKPFFEYTFEDFENALTAIKEKGYYTANETLQHQYSDDTIKTFWSNLRSLYNYLVFIGACKVSLFWGSKTRIKEESTEEDKNIIEFVKLQKSLSPLAEKSIFESVMQNPEQDGEYFGVALMFGLGLRNSEACGARFSDVVKMKGASEFYALRVIVTVSQKELKLGEKTKNLFRYVPIPEKLKKLIDKRLEFIKNSEYYSMLSSGKKGFNIMDLTIACKGNDFGKICSTIDLSLAGKLLLKQARVDEKTLQFIDNDIYKDDEVVEKEATAYLFRRNFATMLQILGLTQNEIEYIMGHKIESNTDNRNYFSNIDKLCIIKEKMDNRPLFVSEYASDITKELTNNTEPDFYNPYRQKIIIPEGLGPGNIVISFQAASPGENVEIGIKSEGKNPQIKYNVFGSMTKRDNNDRTTSVVKVVHHIYSLKKGAPKEE